MSWLSEYVTVDGVRLPLHPHRRIRPHRGHGPRHHRQRPLLVTRGAPPGRCLRHHHVRRPAATAFLNAPADGYTYPAARPRSGRPHRRSATRSARPFSAIPWVPASPSPPPPTIPISCAASSWRIPPCALPPCSLPSSRPAGFRCTATRSAATPPPPERRCWPTCASAIRTGPKRRSIPGPTPRSRSGPRSRLWWAAPIRIGENDLPAVRCPILLITADPELGGIVTPEIAAQAAELWQCGQVVHIPGAGHSIRRDEFEPYMAAVSTFLRCID